MKIVFLSNYFSHHQKPLSDALAAEAEYTFVATGRISDDRRALGWGNGPEPDYVCSLDRDPQRAQRCIREADVVIAGSAPEKLVRGCILRWQPVLRYCERPLKKGPEPKKYLPRLLKWHWQNPPGKPIGMLCASAYTAADYAAFGLFRGKALRWGYFPEVKQYPDRRSLWEKKEPDYILWVGRFLDWKHPEAALTVAKYLKEENVPFRLKLIGTGPMEERLREIVEKEGLSAQVQLPGAMSPEEVRSQMEKAVVFLFTSDRQEGWGAVLNEAMSSGCAVVASHAAGATPYLVRDGVNGLVYPSEDVTGLCCRVKELLCDSALRQSLAEAALETVAQEWNAQLAAKRLLAVLEKFRAGESFTRLYAAGPCSEAEILKDNWYQDGSETTIS